MNSKDFEESLDGSQPPAGLTPALRGLWLDGAGHWEDGHAAVQDESSRDAALVHAYLHRKEGDASNAAYWYRRAEREVCTTTLEDEWSALVKELLSAG